MTKTNDQILKIERLKKESAYLSLNKKEQKFIQEKAIELNFSYQQIKSLIDIGRDLFMWGEGSIEDFWPVSDAKNPNRKLILKEIIEKWEKLKSLKKDYKKFIPDNRNQQAYKFITANEDSVILGDCPVSSTKTRCCNLLTLDVIRNCGYDCNYCCIQSYFHNNEIIIEKNLLKKLQNIEFDKDKIYHIGTGQSSDSLMWGNKDGILNTLLNFAQMNPNIILELKTKSGHYKDLIRETIPKNVLTTWTVNTQTIINCEERLTSSLDERLKAARKVADKGALVGFHLHPIVFYDGWEDEYKALVAKILEVFSPKEIAMISFGTLTYIKPVIKKIRKRKIKSKVLQMSLENIEGKLSYPRDIKLKMFKSVYNLFKDWHNKIFFYLCMEDIEIWELVFGYSYDDNDIFEDAMKKSYMKKIMSF